MYEDNMYIKWQSVLKANLNRYAHSSLANRQTGLKTRQISAYFFLAETKCLDVTV